MIVEMKKVYLVVMEKKKRSALEHLGHAGVVHLEEVEGKGKDLTDIKNTYANVQGALSLLQEVKLPKKYKADKAEDADLTQLSKHLLDLSDRKKALLSQNVINTNEIERLKRWGEVDPNSFADLSKENIYIKMFEIPTSKYKTIPEDIETVRVGTFKKDTMFLTFGEFSQADMPGEAHEVILPNRSTAQIQLAIDSAEKELQQIDDEFLKDTAYIPKLQENLAFLEDAIEFENIRSGMGQEEDTGPNTLAWLVGYVPTDSIDKIKDAAKRHGWGIAFADIAEEDDPPTKLKNNKLVSLIYPVTDFLGTVPGYREFDISGWFLFFFAIFFGMIFGDAGYGLLIVLLGVILMLRAKAKGDKIQDAYWLVIILGFATVAWGIVTCSWFGLEMDQVPDVLKAISVPPLSNAYKDIYATQPLTTASYLQIFCFSLALFQLSVAHITCIIANRKSLKCIGDLGSLIMLWGIFYIVLMLVVSSTVFSMDTVLNVFGIAIPIGIVAMAAIGVGFILSFIFSSYEGNLKDSILDSCKNIISVLLGVVNVFSDIVSYIRLWAVALAGGAIASTVNTMAGPLLGSAIMFIAFAALLLFGHGLNMMLNVLSVIVHGVRLNTLEFSSHLGMSWSGYKYKPFTRVKED